MGMSCPLVIELCPDGLGRCRRCHEGAAEELGYLVDDDAIHEQRLPEWNCVCIRADEQAWGVRSVAPGGIDAADDHRVTRLHEHLIGVGDEVHLAAHARE